MGWEKGAVAGNLNPNLNWFGFGFEFGFGFGFGLGIGLALTLTLTLTLTLSLTLERPGPVAKELAGSVAPGSALTVKGLPAMCTPPVLTWSSHWPRVVRLYVTSYEPSPLSTKPPSTW